MLESNYTNGSQAPLRENLRQTMTTNSEKTKLLLFISEDSCQDGCVFHSVFEEEAGKLDVVWMSQSMLLNRSVDSGVCPEVRQDDLQKADMVVLIRKPSSLSAGSSNLSSSASAMLKSKFHSWSGKPETWDFPAGEITRESISQHIGKLLVRLILQGGKRQASGAQSVSSNPNLHTSGGGGSPNIGANDPKGGESKVSKDTVRVSRESKGRGGKTVTVVSGLSLEDAKLQDLAKRLKQACGTGGTVKEGKIEIQGDQCERVLAELQSRGYKAKRSGG